ncbi:MAG: hypothetical protein NTW17_01370 [Candidatus Pacearchaeota archaeon]|nr:hypothetical protein [Candidatus Pacearchaeota archaeon]
MCLGRNLLLGSYNGSLAYSDDIGRVVLVSTAESGSQDLNAYLEELKQTKEAEEANLKAKYEKAKAVLMGK